MFSFKEHEAAKPALLGSEFLAQIEFNKLLGFQKVCGVVLVSIAHFLHSSSAYYLVENNVVYPVLVLVVLGQYLLVLRTLFSQLHLI